MLGHGYHSSECGLLSDADYWSRLAAHLCFDPLLRDYIQHAASICLNNPFPERMPMLAENIPGARVTSLQQSVDHDNVATVNTIVHSCPIFDYLHLC